MTNITVDVLIPLRDCIKLVHSPSLTAYRKRYMKFNVTGHPLPVSRRPMLFLRAEWEAWFWRYFKTKL